VQVAADQIADVSFSALEVGLLLEVSDQLLGFREDVLFVVVG
jgi:hypothetical protein